MSMEDINCADTLWQEDGPTIELPPKQQIPFLQSSQTVRRCDDSTQLPGQPTARSKPKISFDLEEFLARQESRENHGDESTASQRSRSGSRSLSTRSLPKPSELFSRPRKRSNKDRHVLPRNAATVADHVVQLRRKNSHFFGGVMKDKESPLPYVPHETTVHVTRDSLQEVPNTAEVIQHPCITPSIWSDQEASPVTGVPQLGPSLGPSFWSTNDWLCGPSSSTGRVDQAAGIPLSVLHNVENKAPFMETPLATAVPGMGKDLQGGTADGRNMYFFTPNLVNLQKYAEE